MMIRVLWCGIRIWTCGVVYSTYGATAWCTRTRNCTVRGERRGADGEATVLFYLLEIVAGLEYASLKYHRRKSVIIIASLLEYKRALLVYILLVVPTRSACRRP